MLRCKKHLIPRSALETVPLSVRTGPSGVCSLGAFEAVLQDGWLSRRSRRITPQHGCMVLPQSNLSYVGILSWGEEKKQEKKKDSDSCSEIFIR